MIIRAADKFKNFMVRHTFGGFVPWGPCFLLLLLAMELLYFVLLSVERSDLVGCPRGAEPSESQRAPAIRKRPQGRRGGYL